MLPLCRARGNAEATLVVKDKAASRFLGYLDEAGAGDLAALSVRDVSGFLLRQRGLRRKTVAGLRSALADFLGFLAGEGLAPQGLAGRLPPHRHLRHESERTCATAEEIRRLLAVIDRQSATGKRDYAIDPDDRPARPADLRPARARAGRPGLAGEGPHRSSSARRDGR